MKKIIFGLILILAASAVMAVPQYLNYQGVLRDNAGNLVTGTKTMTFKIFDEATGGSDKFSMTSSEVVSNGLYTVQLGPLGYAELGSGRRWLEVTVVSETLSPRLEILAVAYAVTAASAESAVKLGNYLPASSGASIIPVTDSSGKLSSSVIPTSGLNADTANTANIANYATLAGAATTAATATNAINATNATNANNANTVNHIPASTEALANQLLALDTNKQLKGMSVSAEATTSGGFAAFFNGRIGASVCVGTDSVPTGTAGVTISNSAVTSSSIILLTVGHGTTPETNASEALRIHDVQNNVGFTVKTVDGNNDSGSDIPFGYLIIN